MALAEKASHLHTDNILRTFWPLDKASLRQCAWLGDARAAAQVHLERPAAVVGDVKWLPRGHRRWPARHCGRGRRTAPHRAAAEEITKRSPAAPTSAQHWIPFHTFCECAHKNWTKSCHCQGLLYLCRVHGLVGKSVHMFRLGGCG